jgi:hypothetical protein
MPSLMRFLTAVAVLCGLAYGALFALATFVSPRTREFTVTIPAQKLKPVAEAPKGARAGASSADATP